MARVTVCFLVAAGLMFDYVIQRPDKGNSSTIQTTYFYITPIRAPHTLLSLIDRLHEKRRDISHSRPAGPDADAS